MHDPERQEGQRGRPSRSRSTASSPVEAGTDPLEDLIADLLEARDEDRDAALARLELEDHERARRVRSRLGALGDLGFSLDEPRRTPSVPASFGAFRRLERVGVGGMGEVYLARHEESGQLAALKLVRPDHLWFQNARDRFRREVAATLPLRHPDIVRVLEVGEEAGVPWLALEWIGGASLEQVLDRLRGMPPESIEVGDFEDAVRRASAARLHAEPAREGAFPGRTYAEVVARLVARIARALAHAHDAGVLHRDVKPSNILVTPSGRVLLADFGLALPRGADRMTRTGSWLGSLPYAAPEQIDGHPRSLDRRADVYSLGATLYELVTLRTPFLGGPESAVRRRITTGDLESPRRLNARLPPELETILLGALDPDPGRRPDGGLALAEDIERALAGRPVRSRRAPALVRVQRWARRRPAVAAVSIVLAVVVLGSIGFALRERSLAARLVRLADAELVRGLRAESREFWPAALGNAARTSAWLARAREVLARGPEHRRALEDVAALALPYAREERERDHRTTCDDLAALSHELDGLTALVASGDRNSRLAPPDPASVRQRALDTRAMLSRSPEELVVVLRGRVASLRQAMRLDAARWQPDLRQIEDFERFLDRSEADLRRRTTYRFADPLDGWRHGALSRLLVDLDLLEADVQRVVAQERTCADLEARFVGPDAGAWAEARAAIRAAPRYGGLEVEPCFGLVPLGANRRTGLWEFLVAESGDAPRPDPDRPGQWLLQESTGLVLVLLPGGRTSIGQREGEGPRIAAATPLHEVELAPFFVSRYELTVAQSERLGGFPPEKARPADGCLPLALDFERVHALVRDHGLELPTEAQWEYAARADTTPLPPLEGAANVLDGARMSRLRDETAIDAGIVAGFDDGFVDAAPVGTFAPNAFGLHDTLGNVSEWCLDHFVLRGYSTLIPRSGDGLRATVVSAQLRSVRGGSFLDGPNGCRPAARLNEAPGKMTYSIGVRPVRPLVPRR